MVQSVVANSDAEFAGQVRCGSYRLIPEFDKQTMTVRRTKMILELLDCCQDVIHVVAERDIHLSHPHIVCMIRFVEIVADGVEFVAIDPCSTW